MNDFTHGLHGGRATNRAAGTMDSDDIFLGVQGTRDDFIYGRHRGKPGRGTNKKLLTQDNDSRRCLASLQICCRVTYFMNGSQPNNGTLVHNIFAISKSSRNIRILESTV
jgi:hypothetical protein